MAEVVSLTQKCFYRREMNFPGSEYYRLNRRLLLLIGLWPYEHSVVKYCQVALCNIITGYLTVSQVAKLIELRRNVGVMMSLLSPTIVCFIYIIKYCTFCIVARKIRRLMDHVEKDWNMLKDKRELEIMGRYTYLGSMLTLGFTILGYVSVVSISLLPLVPNILDVLAPLNVSRPRSLMFPGEFFVNEQKYFYVLLLHINVSLGLLVTTLVGTESLYVTYVLHACGMFRVASYRVDHAFGNRQTRAPEKQAVVVYEKLTEAVRIHNRALEFSEFLWSTLAVSYSALLAIGVASLVINLFCLFEAILFTKELNELIRLSVFSFGHVFYFFLGNYVGQILIDHSTDILRNTYVTRWYGAPVQAQKLLPVIMQRSMRSCKMSVGGGMFIPSFEGFATLMSTAVSYFTVLWSVHK